MLVVKMYTGTEDGEQRGDSDLNSLLLPPPPTLHLLEVRGLCLHTQPLPKML